MTSSNATRPDDGGDELPFDWTALVPAIVHPMRLAILEAMAWTGRPISATDMKRILEERVSVSHVSYHFTVLAEKRAAFIELVDKRQVRGSQEKFYFLRGMKPLP